MKRPLGRDFIVEHDGEASEPCYVEEVIGGMVVDLDVQNVINIKPGESVVTGGGALATATIRRLSS